MVIRQHEKISILFDSQIRKYLFFCFVRRSDIYLEFDWQSMGKTWIDPIVSSTRRRRRNLICI